MSLATLGLPHETNFLFSALCIGILRAAAIKNGRSLSTLDNWPEDAKSHSGNTGIQKSSGLKLGCLSQSQVRQ